MEAHFRSKDGGHAFFECNGAVARLPLPQAYSVYLSGPEGNRATTALADGSWALVAIHGRAVEKKKQCGGNVYDCVTTRRGAETTTCLV